MFLRFIAYVDPNFPCTSGTFVKKEEVRPPGVSGNNHIYRITTRDNRTLYMSLQCAAVQSYDASEYKEVGVAHEYVGNVSDGWVIYN